MIFTNIELEKIEGKMYQFFPLQSSIIPRHIQMDTKSVIELLVDKGKKEYLDNIEVNKEFLWDKFFNITQKIKDYKFDNIYSLSIIIHNTYIMLAPLSRHYVLFFYYLQCVFLVQF